MTEQKRAPVNYLVKEDSLIDNRIYQAGSIAPYDGLPSENLEPQCDEGRARAAEYEQSNKERIARMVADNQQSAVGDPNSFAEAFAKALSDQRAEFQAQLAQVLAAVTPAPAADGSAEGPTKRTRA